MKWIQLKQINALIWHLHQQDYFHVQAPGEHSSDESNASNKQKFNGMLKNLIEELAKMIKWPKE